MSDVIYRDCYRENRDKVARQLFHVELLILSLWDVALRDLFERAASFLAKKH